MIPGVKWTTPLVILILIFNSAPFLPKLGQDGESNMAELRSLSANSNTLNESGSLNRNTKLFTLQIEVPEPETDENKKNHIVSRFA